jgi:argininosuccinate lyase
MVEEYHFGKGGRLGAGAEDALVRSAYRHDCADADILLDGLNAADMAHAVALSDAGVIPKDAQSALFTALVETSHAPEGSITIDPSLGDVYNCREAYLKQTYGDVSGWLNAGRARREAVNISFLLATRHRVLDMSRALGNLGQIMARLADDHKDTIMPDFTYLHHAQPTVFGHYLLTFGFPILRDFDRLSGYFDRLNQSPAGSGSVNGTPLGVDRDHLAELLGFEAALPHTRDAMWQVDVPIEGMSVLIAMMTNISRLCDELQIWNSAEFSIVDLPDSLCRASVIMPQKKNPYPLTYIRGLTSDILGKVASFAAHGKIMSGNPDSRTFVYGELPRTLDRCTEALDLLAAVLDGLKLNKGLLEKRARSGYLYATDLAERLMLDHQLDYRSAHKIVGAYVKRRSDDTAKAGGELDDLIDAFTSVTGGSCKMDQAWFDSVRDAKSIIDSRTGLGGAAPAPLSQAIATFLEGLAKAEENWSQRAEVAKLTKLRSIVKSISGEEPNV